MISIMDDDRIVREAVGDLVQSLGYEVATFDSAEEFLDSGRVAHRAASDGNEEIAPPGDISRRTRRVGSGAS
jgi:hypothetical protein